MEYFSVRIPDILQTNYESTLHVLIMHLKVSSMEVVERSNQFYKFMFFIILTQLTRNISATEAISNANIPVRSSLVENRYHGHNSSLHETARMRKATVCPKIKLMKAKRFNMRKISPKQSIQIISDFTLRSSLSIVIGHCLYFPSWLRKIKCSRDLHVYIYLKCQTSVDEVFLKFSRKRYFCIKPVPLSAGIFVGQQGTIKHFLYEHYYNLTDYSVFIKDTDRKTFGVPVEVRLASALKNVEKNPEGISFMTLSDIPPAYQSRIRKQTAKTRSIRPSISALVDIENYTMRQDPNSEASKYCRIFEKFTCTSCKRVWIPVRSQFLISSEAVRVINIEEFNIKTSLHGEYTWALLFNCFVEKLFIKRNTINYPFIACLR